MRTHAGPRGGVSIRSPDRSQGRPGYRFRQRDPLGVSIRSPDRSQGRPSTWPRIRLIWAFQSAPLTGVRGDSLPCACVWELRLFQSAPLTGVRGDVDIRGQRPLDIVSIRSPDRSQGRRDNRLGECRLGYCVSIRSPDRSQGRLRGSVRAPFILVFQSAPLTGVRGDRRTCPRPSNYACFNPLP